MFFGAAFDWRKIFSALFLTLALAACATTQAGPNGLADRDPREAFNRNIWEVNQAADSAVIRPTSEVYRAVTPRPLRNNVTNVFRNLSEPWSFVNNLLQGNPGRAARNLGRFLVNSTLGIGGLFDVASAIGIEPAPEDFGQTLAVWGVGDGGYQVLPIFGPSTARDTVGTIVDFFGNPSSIFLDRVARLSTLEQWGIRGLEIVSTRANATDAGVDAFLETSADPYAAARAAYFEAREAEILNYDTEGFGDEEDMDSGGDDALDAAIEELEQDETLGESPPQDDAETPDEPMLEEPDAAPE